MVDLSIAMLNYQRVDRLSHDLKGFEQGGAGFRNHPQYLRVYNS